MFRFLHTADIHLDSPLLNLDRYDGAPTEAFRSATRRAFDRLVDLAIAEEVKFILIAGDLYDGDSRDFNTPLHFRRKMEELRSHNIRVFICQGNHDAQSNMRKAFRLQLPENTHVFSTKKPETVRMDELKVAIHGQGFAKPAIEHDLSPDYPPPETGWLNFGMLHTSCGVHEAHDRYAPSSVAGLTGKGYQYWALGHIHKGATLAGSDPWIIYPGNPQGRHIRETGAKGCVLGKVEDGRITIERRTVDVLRWEIVSLDVSQLDDPDRMIGEACSKIAESVDAADGRPLAVRVEFRGTTSAHRRLAGHADHWDRRLREDTVDRFDEAVWIEKIVFSTQPTTESVALEDMDSPVRGLLECVCDAAAGHAAFAEIREDLEQFLKQLPTDPRLPCESAQLDDERTVASLIQGAQDLITSGLLEPGETKQ
jgi:DNA repair exonuclease SbcCD nuclease subunit